jgi:Tfp pilus assembly protein PilO
MPSSAVLSLWWFSAIVVVLIFAGTMLVLVPQVKSAVELGKKLNAVEAEYDKAQAKVTQIGLLDQGRIDELHQMMSLALPPQKPYYEVLLSLQHNAQTSGVSLGDFSISPGSLATESAQAVKASSQGLVTLPTSLSVQGTTEQVTNFVISLQNSLPLVKITGITISGDRNQSENDSRQAQIDLIIAYLIDLPVQSLIGYEPLPPLGSDVDQLYATLRSYENPVEIAEQVDPALTDVTRTDLFNF